MANRIQIPYVVETFIEDEAKQLVATPVVGATVTVLNRITSLAAPVYATETAAEAAGPFATDEAGRIPGWVNEGSYTITVTGGTPTLATTSYGFDAVSGRGAEKIGNTSVELQDLVTAVREALVPTATILPFGGDSAPSGYLLCDGKPYKEATYPELAAKIGTKYGSPKAGEFNVPDIQGRTLVGSGSGGGLTARSTGQKAGEEKHLLIATESGLPLHAHGVVGFDPAFGAAVGNSGFFAGINGSNAGAHSPEPKTSSVGGTAAAEAHNIMQPYTVVNYIIKY